MTHYVSKPMLRAFKDSKSHVLIAACGTISPPKVTPTPRLVTCPACASNMISEERNP